METKAWREKRDKLMSALAVALRWGHRDCASKLAQELGELMKVPTVPEMESKTIAAECCHFLREIRGQ